MNIKQEIIVNIDVNVAAIMMLLGVLIISLRSVRVRDTRFLLLICNVCTLIIAGVINIALCFLEGPVYHGSRLLTSLLNLALEGCCNVMMYFWLLYTLYSIFKNREYVIRKLPVYAIPLIVVIIADIINIFTGFIWYYDDDIVYHVTPYYVIYDFVRYMYLVYSIFLHVRFRRQEQSSTSLHICLFMIPILITGLIESITGYTVFVLGAALGHTALYMLLAGEMGYIDFESGFYNPYYLSFLYRQVDGGSYNLSSIILYRLAEGEDVDGFAKLLHAMVPVECHTIRTGEYGFITVSETARRGYVTMVMDDVSMMAEDAGINVEIEDITRDRNQLPADFFIDNIRLQLPGRR